MLIDIIIDDIDIIADIDIAINIIDIIDIDDDDI
jgi:hypothetical protein